MRALIYYVATTLDGFIADPDGGFDAFAQQGDHLPTFLAELPRFGAVLMGRATYEVGLAMGVTDPYPMIERPFVVSTTMTERPDPRVELISAEVVDRVRQLKAEPGDPIWLCGGGRLARTLWDAGLIDEIWLKQNPLVLGAGIPVFAPGGVDPRQLTLQDVRRFDSGVCELRYRVE